MVVHVRRRRHATRRIGVDRGGHHPRRRRRNPRHRTSRSPVSSSPAPSPRSPSACSRWCAADDSPPRSRSPSTALAVGAWAATRLFDISWIAGLEHSEAPGFTDTVCAALGAIAAIAALAALIRRRTAVTAVHLGVPAWAIGSFVVVAMLLGATHRPRRRRGRRAHPRRRRRGAGARHHRRAQPRRDRRWHRRRRPRRARRRPELAAGRTTRPSRSTCRASPA